MTDLTEEPWEADIGAMLGRLPQVDPPPGFIDQAVNHRPLFAGRMVAGLMALSAVAVVVTVLTGAVGRSRITPQIDELADRHSNAVEAGVFGTGSGASVQTPLEMPTGFERSGDLAVEELRHAVYDRGDESVSIFVQPGTVLWESLPEQGLTEIDGQRIWLDRNRDLTVIQAADEVVTIVGLPAEEVEAVLATVPRSGPSVAQRIHNLVTAVTGQLGYPETD